MKFSIHRDEVNRKIVFSGEFSEAELTRLRLDRLERAVLSTPTESSADVLHDLELIYRRHQEQQP